MNNERFNLDDYVLVADRILEFWKRFPEGRIITHIVQLDAAGTEQRMVTIRTEIYGDLVDERPLTTGLSQAREGTAGANKTAFVENCETSSIGRALANLGIKADKRHSKEEMEAVK